MNTLSPPHSQLVEVVNTLPAEVLPELASFLTYLQFKTLVPNVTIQSYAELNEGNGNQEQSTRALKDSVIQYIDPLEPVAVDSKIHNYPYVNT